MPLAINKTLTPSWFTPKRFRSDDQPPRFYLQPITGAQRLEVLSEFDPGSKMFTARGVMLALQYGLKDWENIVNQRGKQIAYKWGNVQYLPESVLTDVAFEIVAISDLESHDDEDEDDEDGEDSSGEVDETKIREGDTKN